MRNSCKSHGPTEHGSLLSTPSILAGFGEWRRDAVWNGGSIHWGQASGTQSLRSMRRSTARSSSSEYCSSRASSSCRTEEKVFLRSWVMRLCSTEGVLQLATCNRTPEVSWRNSGGDCQRMQKGEGPRPGRACSQEGTACPAGCGQEFRMPRSASMIRG